MIKKLSILILISILLISCSQASEILQQNTSITDASSQMNTAETEINNISILTSGANQMANPQIGNENGYYYTYADGYKTNIIYADYNTQKEYYLCVNLGCSHNDESCTSYIETDGFLFLQNEKLYLLQNSIGLDSDNQKILEMDLNGDNRKIIYNFKDNESYLGGNIFGDGENIYLVLFDSNLESNILAKISLNTQNLENITTLEDMSYIIGASDNRIYIHKFKEFDKKVHLNAGESYIEVINILTNQIEVVFEFPKMQEEEVIIRDINYISHSTNSGYKMNGEYLYFANEESETLQIININDNSISKEINIADVFLANEKVSIEFINDKILVCSILYGEERYIINLLDGTIIKSELQTIYGKGSNEKRILAPTHITNNYVVFYNGSEPTKRNQTMPDGTIETVNLTMPVLNIISIYDYINNIENYKRISLFSE